MKINVYSVYDSKAKTFDQPRLMLNDGVAYRAWMDAANNPNESIGKYPADYTLFRIAEWDDETGQFTMLEMRHSLGTAIEHIRPAAAPMALNSLPQEGNV